MVIRVGNRWWRVIYLYIWEGLSRLSTWEIRHLLNAKRAIAVLAPRVRSRPALCCLCSGAYRARGTQQRVLLACYSANRFSVVISTSVRRGRQEGKRNGDLLFYFIALTPGFLLSLSTEEGKVWKYYSRKKSSGALCVIPLVCRETCIIGSRFRVNLWKSSTSALVAVRHVKGKIQTLATEDRFWR